MSVRHGDALRSRGRRHTAALAGLVTVVLLAAGCSFDSNGKSAAPRADGGTPSAADSATTSASAPAVSAVSFSSNVAKRGVKVDKVVKLTAAEGTFESVTVRVGRSDKQVQGTVSADKTTWTSSDRLEPDTRYRVRAVAVDADGLKATKRTSFRTEDLTLDQQTFPSFAPLEGETVGSLAPTSPCRPTSTACRLATASTDRRAAPAPSTSVTR